MRHRYHCAVTYHLPDDKKTQILSPHTTTNMARNQTNYGARKWCPFTSPHSTRLIPYDYKHGSSLLEQWQDGARSGKSEQSSGG